ncbi:MAG: iron ABC transporter permease [Candidatus Methanomethylophilaceae archaeon]|nr:iron ABC transporter permease [Candidatus Methanomethylophilaceae archaeon]
MHIMHFFFGEDYTHNTRSKRKVRAVVIVGMLMTLAVGILSLCVGAETTFGIGDAIGYAISSISKGGHNLTYEEMLIYNQRLPRVLATIAVGVGLSVAGAMYQAIIKNPLVEPYIMGVSSGAGTFAVAVLTFDFTFFGLFASNSIYLTAFSAIFGGLLAFGLTMLLAIKTGGKSINYVLAGIVIGLVFSAVQSLIMIDAGTKVASALSWLYGSFSTMNWDKLWLVLIPSLTLSFIPLVWAKEFNLILLGEDQAKQMGLNARRFQIVMLIIASVLTSFCVAFCGIIGFVGLVIPHLSRMILGGDHRLMLPATMAFGGFLMVAADLLARVLLTGYELPVGAITTMIGVPVFAYLLIKRGRSYDG